MSGAGRNKKKKVREPRGVRARLEVGACCKEPEKAWNDLWARILADFAITQAPEADATTQSQAGAATRGAGHDGTRGKMERG